MRVNRREDHVQVVAEVAEQAELSRREMALGHVRSPNNQKHKSHGAYGALVLGLRVGGTGSNQ